MYDMRYRYQDRTEGWAQPQRANIKRTGVWFIFILYKRLPLPAFIFGIKLVVVVFLLKIDAHALEANEIIASVLCINTIVKALGNRCFRSSILIQYRTDQRSEFRISFNTVSITVEATRFDFVYFLFQLATKFNSECRPFSVLRTHFWARIFILFAMLSTYRIWKHVWIQIRTSENSPSTYTLLNSS